MIYKRLTPVAVYCINFLVTIFDFHPIPALYLVSTIYKGEAIANAL